MKNLIFAMPVERRENLEMEINETLGDGKGRAAEGYLLRTEVTNLQVQLMKYKQLYHFDREEFAKEYLMLTQKFEEQKLELRKSREECERKDKVNETLSQMMKKSEKEKEELRKNLQDNKDQMKSLNQKVRCEQDYLKEREEPLNNLSETTRNSISELQTILPPIKEASSTILIRPTLLKRQKSGTSRHRVGNSTTPRTSQTFPQISKSSSIIDNFITQNNDIVEEEEEY